MPPKRNTRRANSKYPALDPELNLKTRFEQLDFDYIKKLPDTWTDPKTGKKYNPKQFLNDFANEFIHADFTSNKKRIHKKKKVDGKDNKYIKSLMEETHNKFKELVYNLNNSGISTTRKMKLKKILNRSKVELEKNIKELLHYIDDFYKKEAEDKNNSRNRCRYTKGNAQNKTMGLSQLSETFLAFGNLEDELIDKIDRERESDLFEESQESENSSDES